MTQVFIALFGLSSIWMALPAEKNGAAGIELSEWSVDPRVTVTEFVSNGNRYGLNANRWDSAFAEEQSGRREQHGRYKRDDSDARRAVTG